MRLDFIKNGEIHGEYKSYWENGQLEQICSCVDGKLNGIYEKYDINGKLFEYGSYVDGEKVDLFNLY